MKGTHGCSCTGTGFNPRTHTTVPGNLKLPSGLSQQQACMWCINVIAAKDPEPLPCPHKKKNHTGCPLVTSEVYSTSTSCPISMCCSVINILNLNVKILLNQVKLFHHPPHQQNNAILSIFSVVPIYRPHFKLNNPTGFNIEPELKYMDSFTKVRKRIQSPRDTWSLKIVYLRDRHLSERSLFGGVEVGFCLESKLSPHRGCLRRSPNRNLLA